MRLTLDATIVDGYKSNSQRARVLTESWVDKEIYCPNCGQLKIDKYPNNQPVADFYCSNCKEDYELKGKQDGLGMKIVDGSHRTMLERLTSNNNPNFFLLNYDLPSLTVTNFLVIPKHFFVPEIIERRKPLVSTARRAGWVGCNILLQNIPQSGKIFYIKNRKLERRARVLENWNKTIFLREADKIELRGWILDVMNCIDKLGRNEFILSDIYAFENELGKRHPKNRHIKDKIRQQLQFLRNKGYLEFKGRGKYRLR